MFRREAWRAGRSNIVSMSSATTNHEAEILSRIIAPERHDLPEEAARAILALAFLARDHVIELKR